MSVEGERIPEYSKTSASKVPVSNTEEKDHETDVSGSSVNKYIQVINNELLIQF